MDVDVAMGQIPRSTERISSFIKNLLITKSKACKLDLVKGQASRPYKRTGRH